MDSRGAFRACGPRAFYRKRLYRQQGYGYDAYKTVRMHCYRPRRKVYFQGKKYRIQVDLRGGHHCRNRNRGFIAFLRQKYYQTAQKFSKIC